MSTTHHRKIPIVIREIRAVALALIGACCAAGAPADGPSTSLERLAESDWDMQKAAHLLRRAGFGGTPEQVKQVYEMGLEGAVNYLVDYRKINWSLAPPYFDPIALEDIDRAEVRKLSEEERQQFREDHRKAHQRSFEEVRLWWIDRMVKTPRPLEEKMTLFWHGHFTSGMREVRDAVHMFEQNKFLRDNALGSFRDLLLGISKDCAMLAYLDNRNNVKKKPNENYARELMELFSLGVGHYSEDDVKEAARAFTGWSFDKDGYIFHQAAHDDGEKSFLGKKGRFDGRDIIDIILEQPACSRFMAKNVLEAFCRPNPDKSLVENFALVMRRNKYEMKPTMRALFMSKAFYAPESRGSLIKSPVELLVTAAREFGVTIEDLRAAERAMAGMGQELMQPPNVKGWDGKQKWINTATLYNRYNFVNGLINGTGGSKGRPPRGEKRLERGTRRRDAENGKTPETGKSLDADAERAADAEKTAAAGDEMMTAEEAGEMHAASEELNDEEISAMMTRRTMKAEERMDGGKQPAVDVPELVNKAGVSSAEQIVDLFARSYLAVELPSAKREQLIAYLMGGEGPKATFDVKAKYAESRLRTLLNLIASTPEYQLN